MSLNPSQLRKKADDIRSMGGTSFEAHWLDNLANRIEAYERTLRDIAEARGMFGVDAREDCLWAVHLAGDTISRMEHG